MSRRQVGLAVLSAPLVIGGCSTPDAAPTPPATPSASAPSLAPSTATPTTQGLTDGPVLAAKIDHTHASYPRVGIASADVVYVEPVEAGLTRLLAIFSSSLPARIGPIRSARESDVALLANYGPVAFAFSGASSYTMKRVEKGRQVNLSWDRSRVGYTSAPDRRRPYQVIGHPKQLLARAGGSVPPGDVGLRFGEAPPGGLPATKLSTAWAAAKMTFTWDGEGYRITTDGRDEKDAAASVRTANVIVQHVTLARSGNRDVNGQVTPLAKVIGDGLVRVLRDGRVYDGTWSRKSAASPTAFRTTAGEPIALAAGQTWILLVPTKQKVTVA